MQYLYLTLAAVASFASAQTTSTASSCPAPGATDSQGQYSCNPAHAYPSGQQCLLVDGCYFLSSTLASSSSSAPPASSSSACPAPGATDSQGRYSCNPAHQYPSGQSCLLVDGCYFLSSTLPSSASSAPTSAPTAPAGSLPLGAQCDPFQDPSPCAGGAQCWASNAGLIAACGNFNAACEINAQCAFNTCNNGLCNGLLPSGSSNATSVLPSSTGGYYTGTPTATAPPEFSGAASTLGLMEASGVMAALFAVIAWVM
ncbi:hypothetical protein BU23DRAFT_565619 [Bimuria novae-zelandiae CBS 107.79]|uniref:Uncharacterized protein n=1 Tax=Bimuria novae-zelandiae CBS 107.79 TaxID=1447943 RepID=A0A6A5VPY7_9PLEO|nr:hypothetical protein BU23DRAFT_565619 [Bimuria novae-zelandiae CBS 107.79]